MIWKKQKKQIDDTPKAYGNESFGIPADCTKKQRFSTLKLSVYLVIVVLLCSGVYGGYQLASDYFMPDMTYDVSDFPMLYVKDTSLTVRHEGARKGEFITRADDYKTNHASSMVKLTEDGKTLFYGAESENATGFDLYACTLPAESAPVLIDRGVTEYKTSPDGQQVAYVKGTSLHLYVDQTPTLVAVDVTDFSLSENNQQLLYTKDDGAMLYTCSIGPAPKPILVDQDIRRLLTPLSEYGEIYYVKNDALYCKRYTEPPQLLATEVKDAVMLSNFVYLVKEEVRPVPFSQLFSDEKASADKLATVPKRTDFLVENAAGVLVLDSASYNEALEEFDLSDRRNAMREQLKTNPVTAPTNVLYTLKRGALDEVDFDLADAPLTLSGCETALLYQKLLPPAEKPDFSENKTLEEAHASALALLSAPQNVGLYLLSQNRAPYLALETVPGGQTEISFDRNYLYTIENADETGRGTLMRYTIGGRELRGGVALRPGVTDFLIDETDSSVVLVFDKDRLGICQGTRYTHLSDSSCFTHFYVDGTLYFYDDYSRENQVGMLKTYRDGKVKLVDIGVHDFLVQNLKTVAYIKNYDKSAGWGDLYLKSGASRGKRLDFFVRQLLHPMP